MASKGYHRTSIAEICREAKVANGSFYQYFSSKEEVFTAIVHFGADYLIDSVEHCKTIEELNDSLFQCFSTFGNFFQVFRETEFLREPDESRAFYEPVIERICSVLKISEYHGWAYLGSLTFVALNYCLWKGQAVPESVKNDFLRLALNGISPEPTTIWQDVNMPPSAGTQGNIPCSGRAAITRKALLDAARLLFASDGFALTKISHITETAGVALGTFYVHFSSKEEILRELVQSIGLVFTKEVEAFRGNRKMNRVDAERLNLLAFISSLLTNMDVYRIVREAEFAAPSIGRGYYRNICDRYSKDLERAIHDGEVLDVSSQVMAWAIMGIAHTVGMRWCLWEDAAVFPSDAVSESLRWLLNGHLNCKTE